MNVKNALKKRIMRRVYTIWMVRKATPVAGEMCGLFVLGFWGLKYVSPANIMANAFSAADGLNAFTMFFVRAFQHLSAPSQFALVAAGILGAMILRDVWIQLGRLAEARSKMMLAQ